MPPAAGAETFMSRTCALPRRRRRAERGVRLLEEARHQRLEIGALARSEALLEQRRARLAREQREQRLGAADVPREDHASRSRRGNQRSSSSAAQRWPPRPKASASASTTPASTMREVSRTMSLATFTWSSAISTTKARIAERAARPG